MAKRQQGSSAAQVLDVDVDTRPSSLINHDSCALNALSAKRRAFVLYYCGLQGDDPRTRWNGAKAARAAGYTQENSERWAYQLLREPTIKAALDEVLAALREQHEALARRCLDELQAAAFARIDDVVDVSTGYARLRTDAPAGAWAAVAEISQGDDGLKVKMQPKGPLLATLLRAIGYLQDKAPQVAVVSIDRQDEADDGLYTEDRQRRVREMLGIRTPIDVPGE